LKTAASIPPLPARRVAANPHRYRLRARRETLVVSAAMLVVVGAGILGMWVSARNSTEDNFRHYLINLARTAAAQVDPQLHQLIRRPEQRNGPDYMRVVEPLRRMRTAVPDIHYIYTLVKDGPDLRFVLDAADPGHIRPDGIDDQAGVWQRYGETDITMVAGQAGASTEPFTDAWGRFMSGWAPIGDASGKEIAWVGVDVDADVYVSRLAAAQRWAFLGLVPAGLLITLLGIAYYRVRLRGLEDAQTAIDAAWRDKLTGLANRALFTQHLERAVARVHAGEQQLFAVMFLDFDRFKLVNDTLGHEAGDELLRQIAQRLRGELRTTDNLLEGDHGNLVSRFGGDEFLILINDLHSAADASRIAERLLNALAPVYRVLGTEVHSTASIGIVSSDLGLTSPETVLRNADVAMYEAKRAGRACSVLFNEAMHTRLSRHVSIETSLRRAIGTSEISLVYQPIVDLRSGQMVSAEALVRWNHPTMGNIPPSEFIPIAEDSGLIVPLGEWVMNEACQAMAQWRRQDPKRAPRTISVNQSRTELALGQRLLENVDRILANAQLPAHCLQLEVTEREVMLHPDASLALFNELHQLGIHLAMDDFGTGTSSLALLRDFPFDTVKIDRSFLTNLSVNEHVLAVVRATITLIENLGMSSLAEGVEELAQAEILRSLGCRSAQGYLFSRPVAAAKLLEYTAPRFEPLPANLSRYG
jgi:diguanylate cyclase (GGDEF)-like protein